MTKFHLELHNLLNLRDSKVQMKIIRLFYTKMKTPLFTMMNKSKKITLNKLSKKKANKIRKAA